MKKIIRILSSICLIAVLFSLSACKTGTKGVGSMYNDVDTHNQEKVITEGTIKYSKSLKENTDSFVLNALVADNMVLQRNAVNCIWGTSTKDGEIAVTINEQTYYGTVENGAFQIYLSPMEAGGPYEMAIFNDTDKITIQNVLVGEVFLLAGQSNMQMRVAETFPEEEEQSTYANENIRLFEVKDDYDKEAMEELGSHEVVTWAKASEETVPYYSATGYYFAKELQTKCPDLPIGLVMCCQGATYLSTWIPQYAYEELKNDGSYLPANAADPRLTPALHYNAMVNPIKNFKFKAVLWYQGENQPQSYDKGLVKLIETWRKEFDSPDMGFVVFTLPRLVVDKYNNYVTVDEYAWFASRAMQMRAVKNVENATYCVANDLGSYDDIHPLDKKAIATRGAHAFVSKFYGSTETLSGPRYQSHTVEGSAIEVTFTNVGEGLELKNKHLGFEILNENGKYEAANVEIVDKDTVRIGATTNAPQGFRYGYTNVYPSLTEEEQKEVKNAVCLYNKEGYPAEQINILFNQ